jgi:tRNA pseudouridine38-40 synthase
MARFKLKIEYQGSKYSGWQIQKNARTVQGEIHVAIQRATGQISFDFQGAGRTDAGVHALEQVAHLDIAVALPPELLRIRINDELPADISILSLETAAHRFHARHHAVARSYLYQISRRRTAFGKKLVWWVREDLDLDKMKRAASLFPGMRDCRSFSADDPVEKSTNVLIDRLDLAECGDLLLLRVEGSHFLWRMVRRIVGVIAAVGRGELEVEDVRRFLAVQSPEPARLAAPASGLFLERVYYEGDTRLDQLEPVMRVRSPHAGRSK